MPEPQVLPPFDPYKTLQLHAHAPHELVVEAYWALIAHERRRLALEPDAGLRIAELNAAYGLLLNGGERAAYDEEQGHAEQPVPDVHVTSEHYGLLGFGSTLTIVSDHADFYHLLRIDREAAPEIVDAAYGFLSRQAVGHEVRDVFLRDLLTEAHATLSDPERRAQYDAALIANAANPQYDEITSATAVGGAEAGWHLEYVPEAPTSKAGLRASWAGLLRRVRRAGGGGEAEEQPSEQDRERGMTVRAEQLRLLGLRDAPPVTVVRAGTGSLSSNAQELTLGELIFIDGPRAGEHVALGASAMTIAASFADMRVSDADGVAEPDNADMRLRGDVFVVRRVDGVETVIARHRLALPLEMLHNGDEIRIGLHHVRLTKPASAQASGAKSPNGSQAPSGPTAPNGASANGATASVEGKASGVVKTPTEAKSPAGAKAPSGAKANGAQPLNGISALAAQPANGTPQTNATPPANGTKATQPTNGAQPANGTRPPNGAKAPNGAQSAADGAQPLVGAQPANGAVSADGAEPPQP